MQPLGSLCVSRPSTGVERRREGAANASPLLTGFVALVASGSGRGCAAPIAPAPAPAPPEVRAAEPDTPPATDTDPASAAEPNDRTAVAPPPKVPPKTTEDVIGCLGETEADCMSPAQRSERQRQHRATVEAAAALLSCLDECSAELDGQGSKRAIRAKCHARCR